MVWIEEESLSPIFLSLVGSASENIKMVSDNDSVWPSEGGAVGRRVFIVNCYSTTFLNSVF